MSLKSLSNIMLRNQNIECIVKRQLSSSSSSVTKIHRKTYTRVYPTILVQPDGSSIRIRYHEPRQIITLPFDLTTLSEAEKKQRLERRKPKEKIKIEEDFDDGFDASKYLSMSTKSFVKTKK